MGMFLETLQVLCTLTQDASLDTKTLNLSGFDQQHFPKPPIISVANGILPFLWDIYRILKITPWKSCKIP